MDPKPDDPVEFFAKTRRLRTLAAQTSRHLDLYLGEVRQEVDGHRLDQLGPGRRRRPLLRLDRRPGEIARRHAHAPALHSPRKAQQVVDSINRERVERLVEGGPHEARRHRGGGAGEGGRPMGRGLRAHRRTSTVPDDPPGAAPKSAKARKFFESLNSTNRYAILYRLQDAKRPETRAKRLQKFVEMLKNGEKLYP